MFRKQIAILGVAALVSLVTGSSQTVTRFDDHDGAIERSVQKVDKCQVAVSTRCVIAGTGEPCEDHLQVLKSECPFKKSKKPLNIKVNWKYCNMNQSPMLADVSKTDAIYKNWKKTNNLITSTLEPGDCVELKSKKKFNLCKGGLAMSMKYVGDLPEDGNRYCYGWSFLKVRKQWLKKPKRETTIITEIKCKLASTGEECAGNIIKNSESDICEEVKVDFIYRYSLKNNSKEMDTGVKIVDRRSFIKLKGGKSRLMDVSNMENKASNKENAAVFRQESKSFLINTCDDKTSTMMRIRAGLIGSQKRSTNVIRLAVHSAVKCTPDFIITEVYRNTGKSFVELYTPTCQGQIITDNIWLVKIIDDRIDMVNPRSLKGKKIPNDGFLVVCEIASLDGKCDIITGGGLADDAGSVGAIALITNPSLVNELEDEGVNDDEINDIVVFQNNDVHVIRNEDSEASSIFDQKQWTSKSCDSPESDTPCSFTEGRWGDITSAPAGSGDISGDGSSSNGDGRKGGTSSGDEKKGGASSGDGKKGNPSSVGTTAPTGSKAPKGSNATKGKEGSMKSSNKSKFPKGSKAPNDSSTPKGKRDSSIKGKGKGSISPSYSPVIKR